MIIFGFFMLVVALLLGATNPVAQSITRDHCIARACLFLNNAEINADVKARVDDAREYYDKTLVAYRPTVPEKSPAGCHEFHRDMQKMFTEVPCFFDEKIMGRDETSKIVSVMERSPLANYAIEAEFACAAGRLDGRELRNHGLFKALNS